MNAILRSVRLTPIMASTRNQSTLDPVQSGYLGEMCIQVNDKDEPIGAVSKKECHQKPILHRAFSVFIFNSRREMLLQKRSSTKITFPEVWTNSCCSHPLHNPDEMANDPDFIGVRRAAARKLAHELGLEDVDVERMKVMGRFIYQASSDDQWCEHELDYAIVLPDFDDACRPNPEEVSETRYVDRAGLEEMMADEATRFSPWFELFAEFNWLDNWWSNLGELDELRDVKTINTLN